MTTTSTLTLTQRLPADPSAQLSAELSADLSAQICLTLALTAEDRTRSRHFFETSEGQGVYLQLPRGTVLRDGDLLRSPDSPGLVRIIAKPEPVLTVTGHTPLELLRAAYHLGNRHVPLEVTETYLRLSPDSVLAAMLQQMGLHIHSEVAPFQPETGAYGHDNGRHKAQGHPHQH